MRRNNCYVLDSLDHPLCEPYRDIRSRNWTWVSGWFIAEGPLLVQRLAASRYRAHSLLVEDRLAEQYEQVFLENVPMLVLPHPLIEQLVGFNFHRGVLACGIREPIPDVTELPVWSDEQETWLGLIGVNDPENLGGMLRTAAGMGIRKVLLGPGTVDPYSRRALRVSMGNALSLQLLSTHDPVSCLQRLQKSGMEVVATALNERSQPLETAKRRGPLLLLMGNEKHGLPAEILALADRCVRIDMELGTDSLNVGVAAGIAMYHFCRVARA